MNTGRILRFTLPITVAAIVGVLATMAGQEPAGARAVLLNDITAAAIDRGMRDADPPVEPHTSTDGLARHRVRRSGPYVRGSVIVRFRTGTSSTDRVRTLAVVNGAPTDPLSYADFDIVAIDPDRDPEEAARELSARPDVEYAQARYRVHPTLVPNDPLYSRQWNFPAIDMERAWDINPGATSNIIVAVLDSGVAYRSGLMRYNGIAVSGFPALGRVDVRGESELALLGHQDGPVLVARRRLVVALVRQQGVPKPIQVDLCAHFRPPFFLFAFLLRLRCFFSRRFQSLFCAFHQGLLNSS